MKTFLSAAFIFILISLGIYISYILYSDVEQQTLNYQYQQQETHASQASRSIQNFFENFKHSLHFISEKDEIINFDEKSKSLLKNYYEARIDVLEAITRVSADGKIIYTYPYVPDAIGKNISTQPHNAEIAQTHKPVISDVLTTVQGYRAIIYAYPVFNNSVYDGSISLVIPFDYIANKFFKDIRIGRTGTAFVLSEVGYELYCEQENHVGNSVFNNIQGFTDLEFIANKMLAKENGRGEYSFYDLNSDAIVNKIVTYKHVDLENTYWSIAVLMNRDEILEANRGFITKFTALLMLMLLLIVILIFAIAHQRNKTREAIRKKELKYKDNLEKLVAVRTEELKQLNVSLQQDIIERKKIENELKLAVERVEKSEKIKSEFLAQMSHEIRTPINTILSFSSLIKEDLSEYVSEDLSYGFTGIQSAGKRLIRTIDLILNMSDIQLGTHEYIPKEIDIYKDVIRNLETEYRAQITEKNLLLDVFLKTEETRVVADSYSVNQIFANLIDNAIKYTSKGKIEIEFARNINGELTVSIIDTGMGIGKDYLPNIFDEFSQEDMGYTRKFEGNGLGLALVKKYCELNKATISIHSEKGKGSEFTVTFRN